MIKSMTGYGRAVDTVNGMVVTVEIKSVNHRFFEFSSRIYKTYSFLEDKLKAYLQRYISRGKVDCLVEIETEDIRDSVVQVNHSLVSGYIDAFKEISERYGLEIKNPFDLLIGCSDILTIRQASADEDAVWEAVRSVAEKAVNNFVKMRRIEGEKLKEDILLRAENIIENVGYIEKRSPETVKEYNEKLKAKIAELLGTAQFDEQRILTEAAIFAEKTAVDEETVRLRSHIDQLKMFFETEEPVGRKLDFLVQEINREANTVGSKAADLEIAKKVIEIKADVEKIREQVQNIE